MICRCPWLGTAWLVHYISLCPFSLLSFSPSSPPILPPAQELSQAQLLPHHNWRCWNNSACHIWSRHRLFQAAWTLQSYVLSFFHWRNVLLCPVFQDKPQFPLSSLCAHSLSLQWRSTASPAHTQAVLVLDFHSQCKRKIGRISEIQSLVHSYHNQPPTTYVPVIHSWVMHFHRQQEFYGHSRCLRGEIAVRFSDHRWGQPEDGHASNSG